MENMFSAFVRPQRSNHENYLFRNVPRSNIVTHATGGLKFLYESVRFGEATHSPLAANKYTDLDGCFVPVRHMVLANRYCIQSCVETSGQSAVLVEAKDYFSKMQSVVIKVMHTSYLPVGLKEVETLRKMNSMDPNNISHTIRLLNAFRFQDHICLVFPLLNPLPLTDVIDKKFHHEDEILSAIRKISLHMLSALAFLRGLNIIHADIKPENILLEKDEDLNTVTLIDFGNAIYHTHSEVSLYYTDFELQTQPYRAPEVHLGNPFSMEVDMWSLGCMLLELLTGQLEFSGNDRADSLKKMVSVLGPLPADMCIQGKFYADVESVVAMTHRVESGTMKLMSAFPSIRNYQFFSFLSGLLTYHPDKRMTPWEALRHPFMAPVICIPHFLTGPTLDVGIIKKSDYNFKQNVSTNAQRLYPSTYDLLRAGTNGQHLLPCSNVAFVEPLIISSRLDKDDRTHHQTYERNVCELQGNGDISTSSSGRKETSRPWKYTSPYMHDRRTMTSLKHEPLQQNNRTYGVSGMSDDNISVYDLPRQDRRLQQNRFSSACEISRNKEEIVPNKLLRNVSLSHNNGSRYKNTKQHSSLDSIPHIRQTDQVPVSNNHSVTGNFMNDKLTALMDDSRAVACYKTQLSEMGKSCEKATVKDHTSRTSLYSDTYITDHKRYTTSSDIQEKRIPLARRDKAYIQNDSATSLFNKVTEPSKGYKPSLKRKHSTPPDQAFTQDKISSVLPNHNYPVNSAAECVPNKTEQCSLVEISSHTDQVHSFSTTKILHECQSSVATQKYQPLQNCCGVDRKCVCEDTSCKKTVEDESSTKNIVSGKLSIGDKQRVVSEKTYLKQVYHQNQSLCSDETKLSNPCGHIDIEKAECVKKRELDKSNSSYTNCSQKHSQIKTNCQEATTAPTCPETVNRDQEVMLLDSEDESMQEDIEDSSYPVICNALPNDTTLSNTADCSREGTFTLPSQKIIVPADKHTNIKPVIDSHQNLVEDVQKGASKVHTKTVVRQDMINVCNISPMNNKTCKSSPAASSRKLVSADEQTKNNAKEQETNSELTFIIRKNAKVRKIQRKNLVVDMCNIIDKCCNKNKSVAKLYNCVTQKWTEIILKQKWKHCQGKIKLIKWKNTIT